MHGVSAIEHAIEKTTKSSGFEVFQFFCSHKLGEILTILAQSFQKWRFDWVGHFGG